MGSLWGMSSCKLGCFLNRSKVTRIMFQDFLLAIKRLSFWGFDPQLVQFDWEVSKSWDPMFSCSASVFLGLPQKSDVDISNNKVPFFGPHFLST